MQLSLSQQLESVLFYKTEPVSFSWLAKFLDVSDTEVKEALKQLKQSLEGRGIVLVLHDTSVMLATHPAMSEHIEKLHTKEITSDLSRAAIETLTIILYKGEVTKSDLDYIRGVNSQFMIRNLLVRGLISKKENPQDKRRALYIPSHNTLTFLGISSISELPEHEELLVELSALLDQQPSDES